MTDSTLIIIIAALPTFLASLGAVIIGVVNAARTKSVHALVNSQYTALLERNLAALERIATMLPTPSNVQDAAVAKQIVADHKTQ